MSRHSVARRTAWEWLLDDLRQIHLRESYLAIKARPQVLWWLLLDIGVAFGVFSVLLLALGHPGAFGNWAYAPAIMSGGAFSRQVNREVKARRTTDLLTPQPGASNVRHS